MKRNKLYIYVLVFFIACFLPSCNDDNVNKGSSIFDEDELPAKNEFDLWLDNNFVAAYNIGFKYKYEFISTDFNYALSPADFTLATQMAQVVKYAWLEIYDDVAGAAFTRTYAPKQIVLIGSRAIDASTSTEVLASAEQGMRVVLYRINEMEYTREYINYYYFHTMHHEFSHILHQTINYDPVFELITSNAYMGDNWTDYSSSSGTPTAAYQAGFVSAYASTNPDEDFAETYSIYISSTDIEWEIILSTAGTTGAALITSKTEFIKSYMEDKWGIDLDNLRAKVLHRTGRIEQMELLEFSQEPVNQ